MLIYLRSLWRNWSPWGLRKQLREWLHRDFMLTAAKAKCYDELCAHFGVKNNIAGHIERNYTKKPTA